MWFLRYIVSSIGKKQIMGMTGLVWYFFLFVHLCGNVALIGGQQRFDSYGHLLLSTLGEIIVPCEILFLVCLTLHMILSVQVAFENKAARPIRYVKYKSPARAKGIREGSSLASLSMLYGGIGIALFLAIHVLNFRFGVATANPTTVIGGTRMRDIYSVVLAAFSQPLYTAGYIVAIILVAFHLWHGVQSSVQSAGFNHPKYIRFVKIFSKLYAVFIGGGYTSLAVWAFFQRVSA
jgi:succinate dehydrogenase / fumarate reductase, cytochrome b subunit